MLFLSRCKGVFRQQPFFILRNGGGLFGVKIVVNHDGAALDAEPALLPGFMVGGKRLGADSGYPGFYFHVMLKIELRDVIVAGMGDYQRKCLPFKLHIRVKNL